jgi:hypothetical protein
MYPLLHVTFIVLLGLGRWSGSFCRSRCWHEPVFDYEKSHFQTMGHNSQASGALLDIPANVEGFQVCLSMYALISLLTFSTLP